MTRSSTAGSPPAPGAGNAPDAWQATRVQSSAATQILTHEDDEPPAGKPHDIGQPTGVNECELFVSCAPELAMQQQFEHLRPEFIAVHDIATASSRKLLVGIAAASGRAVQKLVIRRQSYGTALATLEFVELPTADGSSLRMYSTEADADTASRHALARMLLSFSRLGVIMVGELPGHAIASTLKPFHDLMAAGQWQNRQMLLLPLTSAGTLLAQGMEMARGTGVSVHTAPQVMRPADAWGFIYGTWSRLREQAGTEGHRVPALAGAPAREPAAVTRAAEPSEFTGLIERRGPGRLALRPLPAVPAAATRPAPLQGGLLDRYVRQLAELPGVVSCCVFDVASGLEVAHAGTSPGAADLAMHGKALLAGMGASSRSMGLGHALPEAAITLGSHHLLLRAVPGHPGLALHAALDKARANLTLARLQVQRMDAMFEGAPKT